MTLSVNVIVNVGVAASTGVSGVTLFCAGRCGYNLFVIVTECVNNCLCYENLVAYGAVLAFGKTGFGAGRSLCIVDNLGVSESINVISYVLVAAILTGVSGVALVGAGRISNNCLILVCNCGVNAVLDFNDIEIIGIFSDELRSVSNVSLASLSNLDLLNLATVNVHCSIVVNKAVKLTAIDNNGTFYV